MKRTLGIDLGTTNSVMAIIDAKKPRLIPNKEGGRLTPSVVYFPPGNDPIVGKSARSIAYLEPERTISSIKRKMGEDFRVNIDGRSYSPQEISSLILRKLKGDAEYRLGETIERAVITVPAYFDDNQREATREAGKLAGLEVVRIISEPTAAALAYGIGRDDPHTILVWDLGGGTFDVSILELGEDFFEVKAVNGNTRLGGDDWDRCLIDYMIEKFQIHEEIDLKKIPRSFQRLKDSSEGAKIELSTSPSVKIELPFIATRKNIPLHIKQIFTREHFDALTRHLLEKLLPPTRQALADAALTSEDIDRVIFVGGATRMPMVEGLCLYLLGKRPYNSIDPDVVVALGAAIQGGLLDGSLERITLLDVTPLSLGIETSGGLFKRLIARNTIIPCSASEIFTTAENNQTSVDIQVLQGEREMAEDNEKLGKFTLDDIPLSPRGIPRIEVSFSLDADGILNVSALDLHTDNRKEIKLQSPSRLGEEKIKEKFFEAEKLKDSDLAKRKKIESRILARRVIDAAKEILKKQGDLQNRERLEVSIKRLRKMLQNRRRDDLTSAVEEFQQLLRASSI